MLQQVLLGVSTPLCKQILDDLAEEVIQSGVARGEITNREGVELHWWLRDLLTCALLSEETEWWRVKGRDARAAYVRRRQMFPHLLSVVDAAVQGERVGIYRVEATADGGRMHLNEWVVTTIQALVDDIVPRMVEAGVYRPQSTADCATA